MVLQTSSTTLRFVCVLLGVPGDTPPLSTLVYVDCEGRVALATLPQDPPTFSLTGNNILQRFKYPYKLRMSKPRAYTLALVYGAI
jgi:hypothetical protein